MFKPIGIIGYPDPINEIVDFAVKVFNYYNGRINVINTPAVLIVDVDASESFFYFGRKFIPNYVVFYPRVYLKYYNARDNPDDWKGYVITTIIHELHHIDQNDIYYERMYDHPEDVIEDSVKLATDIYILGHVHEVTAFGMSAHYLEMVRERYNRFIQSCLRYGYYPEYKRTDYICHLYNTLMLDESDDSYNKLNEFLHAVFLDDVILSTFKLIINGYIYTVKEQGFLMHISQYNSILANTLCFSVELWHKFKVDTVIDKEHHMYLYIITTMYNEEITSALPEEEGEENVKSHD